MIPAQDKFKICIVSDQLANGGAERCASLLSQFFEKNNCEVHHVVVVDSIEYPYSGQILNLGKLKNKSNGLFNRLQRFCVLNHFFRKNKFDYIIDFRVKRFQIQEFIIAKFIFRSPLLVTVHSYMTDLYFPKNNFLANKIYSDTYINYALHVDLGLKQKNIKGGKIYKFISNKQYNDRLKPLKLSSFQKSLETYLYRFFTGRQINIVRGLFNYPKLKVSIPRYYKFYGGKINDSHERFLFKIFLKKIFPFYKLYKKLG